MNSAANTTVTITITNTIIRDSSVAGAIRNRTGRAVCTERFIVEAQLAQFISSYSGEMFSQGFYGALNTWSGRNAIDAEDASLADYYSGSPALHACIHNQIAFWSYNMLRKAA